ncbi:MULTISPECIES: DivIVA domain-containing protein [Actinosynnema]|uniref:DivIVA domain-containing protein n=1 Tax=Actinosynnema TaxID=40566 RepID=UPI0027E21DB6|nr:DivIVA domain-containing protein [Actinosynnema pretiosum]MCP2095997.1 DivIVA domain-containing protein [Actinosynnema pretiosum]
MDRAGYDVPHGARQQHRPAHPAPLLTARDLGQVTFHRPPPGQPGYDEAQVDNFLDRIEQTLLGRDEVTEQQVRTMRFRPARPGYHGAEVDAFLELVAETLRSTPQRGQAMAPAQGAHATSTSMRPATTPPALSPQDVRAVRFHKPRSGNRGYLEDEVDAFLQRIELTLAGVDSLTAREVQDADFTYVGPGEIGYDEDDVDTFLDMVVLTLERGPARGGQPHLRPQQPGPTQRPAGFPPAGASSAGFPPVGASSAGFPPVNASSAGFPPVNASSAGFPPVNASSAGFPPVNASSAGFPPVKPPPPVFPPAKPSAQSIFTPVHDAPTAAIPTVGSSPFPPAGSSSAGFPPAGASSAGFPPVKASSAGFPPAGASSAGFPPVDASSAGFPPVGASSAGFPPVRSSAFTEERPESPATASSTSLRPTHSRRDAPQDEPDEEQQDARDAPLTARDVRTAAFGKPTRGRRGYQESQVDKFLDRIENTLLGQDDLTASDVREIQFSRPMIGRRGYDETEVDAFLARVEKQLSQTPPPPAGPPVVTSWKQLRAIRIPDASPGQRGYRTTQVDRVLEEVGIALDGMLGASAEEVEKTRFALAMTAGQGYDCAFVDELMPMLVAELKRKGK